MNQFKQAGHTTAYSCPVSEWHLLRLHLFISFGNFMMMMMTRDEKDDDDGQTERQTNRQTERQKDRWSRMNGSLDRQTNRNTLIQTDRQSGNGEGGRKPS